MKRSEVTLPEYFDRYINKVDDVELLDALRISIDELDNAPVEKWKALGDSVYAPGKWTVRDMLQHMIDTERVFTYRAMCFAREEKQRANSFSEEEYAASAKANGRTLESLIEELKLSHQSVLSMFSSFTPEMLNRTGLGFKGPCSVAALGFIIPGHQRWHFQVLEEKYYPLLRVAHEKV